MQKLKPCPYLLYTFYSLTYKKHLANTNNHFHSDNKDMLSRFTNFDINNYFFHSKHQYTINLKDTGTKILQEVYIMEYIAITLIVCLTLIALAMIGKNE